MLTGKRKDEDVVSKVKDTEKLLEPTFYNQTMKKKTIENLEEELRELKKDYKEARKEIEDIKKYAQVLSESREYWKEKIRRRDN